MSHLWDQRNSVLAKSLSLLIPTSLQPEEVNLSYLNSNNFIEFRIHSLKYQGSTTFDCKDSGVRKLEFVAKTPFLFLTVRST